MNSLWVVVRTFFDGVMCVRLLVLSLGVWFSQLRKGADSRRRGGVGALGTGTDPDHEICTDKDGGLFGLECY